MAEYGKRVLRGADQTLLLVAVDARYRTAEIGVAALADFDENQHTSVLHDQVDFTETAVKILRHQL